MLASHPTADIMHRMNNKQKHFLQQSSFYFYLNNRTLFFFYKNVVYKNVKASKYPKIKNVVVILLVAISIYFRGFEKKWRSYKNKSVFHIEVVNASLFCLFCKSVHQLKV